LRSFEKSSLTRMAADAAASRAWTTEIRSIVVAFARETANETLSCTFCVAA